MSTNSQDLSITAMGFNADNSFMALTTTEHFATFNCVPVRRIVKDNSQGGMRCIAQLHRSPILVIVPSGDKPGTSPRRLSLWNCRTKQTIQEYGFDGTILGCAINKDFLVVGTDRFLSVFELKMMSLAIKLPTRAGSVFALSDESEAALLAFPSPVTPDTSSSEGNVSVYSCRQGRLVSQVNAHKTAVSVLSFNRQGTLLASASVTGSLIRVFRAPEGECVFVLRHSVPTPLSLFSFPATSADQQAADKRVSSISFCPKGHFVLSATSPSGARGGYVNVFRVAGLAEIYGINEQRRSITRRGSGGLNSAEGDDSDYCTVRAEDVPAHLTEEEPPSSSQELEGQQQNNASDTPRGVWAEWQQQVKVQAAIQLRNLQKLSQDYLASGTAAAKAAATAVGASAMAAAGTMPLLYARIHSSEPTLQMHGADDPRDRTVGTADAREDSSGSVSHSKGVFGASHGREGPSFFAALNYVPVQSATTEVAGSSDSPGDSAAGEDSTLALNVITAVGGVYRRYNISFLQARSGDEGATISLSDTRPPSSTSALPQTLSELLEDECALLEHI